MKSEWSKAHYRLKLTLKIVKIVVQWLQNARLFVIDASSNTIKIKYKTKIVSDYLG
jgi:hypothetical protein